MRVKILCIGFLISLNALMADDLASPSQFKPLLSFSPPPFITPNELLSHKIENQFDNTPRTSYHSVTNTLNNAFNPFHFASGIYGNSNYNALLFKFRASQIYGTANAHYSKANSYKDGDNHKIDFGYTRMGANVILGFVPNAFNELKATFLYDNIADDKQSHYIMDPVKTLRYVFKFDYRLGEEDLSNTLNLGAFYRNLQRWANNYELRQSANAKTKMQVKRQIFDINAKYNARWQNVENEIGAIYTHDTHLAKRFMMNATTMPFFTHNGFRFANVKVRQMSIFDSFIFHFNEANSLNLGLHYDYNVALIKDKDVIVAQQGATQITPNNMWFAHYGQRVLGSIKKDALSFALKYELKPFSNQNYALFLESLQRIPDNNERFVSINPAGNNAQAHSQAWVSNPFLKPERHNRIKLKALIKSEFYKDYMHSMYDENAFMFGGTLMGDFIDDFILYDRFTRFVSADANTQNLYRRHIITRNVNAKILSANINFAYNFLSHFGINFNTYFNYGENDTDKRALYQIRPLEAQLNLDYEDYAFFGKFNLGWALRAVAKQNRRDDDSTKGLGIDTNKGGFAVLDFYAGLSLKDKIGLRFGVDNVLNKTYSEYISISHVESLTQSAVNAPGRVFYLSIHGNF